MACAIQRFFLLYKPCAHSVELGLLHALSKPLALFSLKPEVLIAASLFHAEWKSSVEIVFVADRHFGSLVA